MKNSAVTIMNGTRYPGDVSADDGFVSVAMSAPRFLKKLSPVRALPGAPVLDSTRSALPACSTRLVDRARVVGFFAAHNTIRKTLRWGRAAGEPPMDSPTIHSLTPYHPQPRF